MEVQYRKIYLSITPKIYKSIIVGSSRPNVLLVAVDSSAWCLNFSNAPPKRKSTKMFE